MLSKEKILETKTMYNHDYHEIIKLLLTISDSTIETQNFVTLFNPHHKSSGEIISENKILVKDSLLALDEKENSFTVDSYVYYLSLICKWNKVDYVPQLHKFFNESLNAICYAFTTLFFDFDNMKVNVETTNICTAAETLGSELFVEDAYYYNWFADTFIYGEDLFNIGLLRREKIIWQ